jgi:hypothetical protein
LGKLVDKLKELVEAMGKPAAVVVKVGGSGRQVQGANGSNRKAGCGGGQIGGIRWEWINLEKLVDKLRELE